MELNQEDEAVLADIRNRIGAAQSAAIAIAAGHALGILFSRGNLAQTTTLNGIMQTDWEMLTRVLAQHVPAIAVASCKKAAQMRWMELEARGDLKRAKFWQNLSNSFK